MKHLLSYEPTLIIALIKAALVCAVAFGLPLDGDQTAAVIGLAGAVLALGAVNRAVVTPVAKVEELGRNIGGNATKLVDAIVGKGD